MKTATRRTTHRRRNAEIDFDRFDRLAGRVERALEELRRINRRRTRWARDRRRVLQERIAAIGSEMDAILRAAGPARN